MADLINIARSGITAYRTALAVTSENVANVNTPGYLRRSVVLSQVGGSQLSPSSGGSSGEGVRVDDVRRAFDALLAGRVRTNSGALAGAEAHQATVASIEALFLPGKGGIAGALDGFFTSLTALSTSPSDTALRRVVLGAGSGLADTIANAASGLTRLRADVMIEAKTAVTLANSHLTALAALQTRMVGQTAGTGSLNPMRDEQDRLLGALADVVAIGVSYDKIGRAKVTMGDSGAGPSLLDGSAVQTLGIAGSDGVVMTLSRNGATVQTRQLAGGILQGYATAVGAVDAALEELDAFAQNVTSDLNSVHRQGLDQTGKPGGDLFALNGWTSGALPANRGTTLVDVEMNAAGAAPAGPLMLVRDASVGAWLAKDAAGATLATGDAMLTLGGVTLHMSGAPRDGDRIAITQTDGAINMRFLPGETSQIAAASATLVAATPGNGGNATVAMTPLAAVPSGIVPLASLLAPGAAGAVSLLQPGVVGIVPAGTATLDLASLGTQATLDFTLSAAQAGAATTLAFQVAGQSHQFDLSAYANGDPVPADRAASDLAADLAAGRLRSTTGLTLAETGVAAAGAGMQLSLSSASGAFDAGGITGAGAPSTGVATAAQAAGGTIQVLTREGRHIAGTPLDAAQIASLITVANGFLPGAVYNSSDLNATDDTAYRGMSVDMALPAGDRTTAVALAAPWAGAGPAPAIAAASLTVDTSAGVPVSIPLPQGATAARAADLINAATDGVTAQASTSVEMASPADGRVSFLLTGSNGAALPVTGDVVGGRMESLARAVNAISSATGITAQLSPESDRLVLTHAGGENIALTGFSHNSGAAVALRAVDGEGRPRAGGAVVLGTGASTVRFTGEVRLASTADFTATLGGLTQTAAADPFRGGMINRTVSSAGAVQDLDFRHQAAIDGSSSAADGTGAVAGSARYTLNVAGITVTFDAGKAGATGPDDIASGLYSLMQSAIGDLANPGVSVALTDGKLRITSTDGSALQVDAQVEALATQRLHLADLPPEELIVSMTGSGALRLAGSVQASPAPPPVPSMTVKVTDAATGQIDVFDTQTGHMIGSRTLDADGTAEIGGMLIVLSGKAASGDSFTVAPNSTGTGDGRALASLIALRFADPVTGQGGFAKSLVEITSAVGAQVQAADARVAVTTSAHEAAETAYAVKSAVDLDAEAAQLVQLQQAYQASAQVLAMARELFDTLLKSL